MSVPMDQMGPVEYTPEELTASLPGAAPASAESSPTPSNAAPVEYTPEELSKQLGIPGFVQPKPPPSTMEKIGGAIKSGVGELGSAFKEAKQDLVGEKTSNKSLSDLITGQQAPVKPSSSKGAQETPIPRKPSLGDIGLAALGAYYKHMTPFGIGMQAATEARNAMTAPGAFVRATGHGIALESAKLERDLASADNALGPQPMWVDANGNPVGALTTADAEKQAKQDVETQKAAIQAIAKVHPAAAQAGQAGPEMLSQLAMAYFGGKLLPEGVEALSKYPQFIRAVKNPVVGNVLRRSYELIKTAPPGMAAMALPSGVEGVNTYHEIKDSGGSVGQAVEGGVAVGLVSDIGASVATGMRGQVLPRVAKAILLGPVYSVGETAATNPFLPANMQQKNTAVGIGVNSLLMGALAGLFGTSDLSPEAVHEMYDNLQTTAKSDPDPAKQASASRILTAANQLHAASGGMSSHALVAASHGEAARQAVLDSTHADLYGKNEAYTRAYDASQGQFRDDAARVQSAKMIAATETASNTSWQEFMKLRRIVDDGMKDHQAALQMHDLLGHAKATLKPETYADLNDFLDTGVEPTEGEEAPVWRQVGLSPQYARDVAVHAIQKGDLPPEARQTLDARRARSAQFAKMFPGVDPRTGEPITPEAQVATTEPAKPEVEGKPEPQEGPPKQPPSGAATLAPREALENYFQRNPYPRSNEVLGYAALVPESIQQSMADWAQTRSPMEIESAYREAAATGQLPAEVAIHETEGRTEPAETPAEQGQAGLRGTEAETQSETQEGVSGNVRPEPAGHEGNPPGEGEPGHGGNAETAEGNAEAAGRVLTPRAEPVQTALADAGVAPDDATVGPKGDIRIAPDASPEAAQKALDVAAADTGATNTEFPEPTPEQAKAGNYRKGGVTFKSDEGDIRVKIENPDGSVRTGDWGSRPLKGVHYGYFPDTVSADGQPLDVLMTHDAHDPNRPIAFIRQHDTTTGKFDELKVVMGARDRNDALQNYWRQYPRDMHLKLTPNGAQDVVMMRRPKALAFIKSGNVDVPPHPVSGKPMLMLRQTVPVEFDSRSGDMSGTRDILDKFGKKHDLSGLEEDAGVYRGQVPRSAIPDLQHALEKNRVELEIQKPSTARAARTGRVGERAQSGSSVARAGVRPGAGRRARTSAPAKRSPAPEGIPFVKSDAPVFEEGVNGRIGAHPASVVGIHYSPKDGLTELDPAEAGTGSAGGERRRFGMGNFGRSGDPMARVMSFYVKDSVAIPAKENVVGGSNRYEAVLNNLYDIATDPDGIGQKAEREGYGTNYDRIAEDIRNAGYDGYVYPRPLAGQHARVATVRGVEGKIPVKEVRLQYEERTPTKFASEVKRTRDKFEEAARQAQDQTKKRTRAPLFMLRQKADEHAAQLYFEMAPSPDFRSEYERFSRLSPDAQKRVSDWMNGEMGPDAVTQEIFGIHEPVVSGWGGYLGKMNPSLRMDYPAGTSVEDLLGHARDVADAYNQKSVMVLRPDLPNKATELDIRFDGADNPEILKKLWTQLREKTHDGVDGFSQIDGGISILNTELKPEDAGQWIDQVHKALSDISAKDGVKYDLEATAQGYDFVGGNYDRYLSSVYGEDRGSVRERGINSLQLHSYASIREGTRRGALYDRKNAEGLVAPGSVGVQVRTDRFRAIARLTRDKPSLGDVADGRRQVAQVERIHSAELKAFDDSHGFVPLPSPKGSGSKLSRDQWIMTRTPNFLRWGGDWLHDPKNADVLLDKETGEPKVFYHETDPRAEAPILTQGFRTDLPLSRFNDWRVPEGTFFKENSAAIGVGGTSRDFKTQLPMFLRMHNPIEVGTKDELIARLGGDIAEKKAELDSEADKGNDEYDRLKVNAEGHPDNKFAAVAVQQFRARFEERFEAPSEEMQKAIRAELEARGHDGVIIERDHGRGGTVKTYIALHPNDAKSAGISSGTFSERPAAMYRKEPFPDTGQRIADVKASTQALVGKFGSKPEVVVHENRATATPEAKDALDDVLGPDDAPPPAMYLDGKLHVFADANTTPAQLEQAVMHEMVHYGLRKVFGSDMDPLLDDIWKNATNDEAFKRTLATYGKAYKGRPDFQRNIAEEYVAHLAETKSDPSAWQKVVDWFRGWARKAGLVHAWTDDDIRHLIRTVYSDLKEGRTSIAGQPAARTTVDYQNGVQRTAYRGAAHGDFVQNKEGDWSFENDDVQADLSRSLVDGEPSLDATPTAEITPQGVKDLAALAGEEHSVLTLPERTPRATVEKAGIPFSTHDGMHVLRPEPSESPMFSMRNSVQADPDTQAIIDQKIGYEKEPTSPWEWAQSAVRNNDARVLANDAMAYSQDAGAYVDLLERKANTGSHGLLFDAVTSAYKMYWLSRNVRQIAMAIMRSGVPTTSEKGYVFRPDSEGLFETWMPLMKTVDGKNLMNLYGAYKVGIRAKRLLHEFNPDGTPKEKLLTEEEADKFIALGKEHPQFKTVFAKEQKFINDMLDFAVERGALDKDTAAAWKRNPYVPFRRIIDGLDIPSEGEQRGYNDKIKSKRLRGMAYALKDPNQALIDNTIRMIDHIYNNDAKRRVMALGELAGAVKRMPLKWTPAHVTVADAMNAMRRAGIEVDRSELDPEDMRKIMTVFHPVPPRERNIESTVENGKLVYWQVNDGRLLSAIHDMRAVNPALLDKVINAVALPAKFVRWGVTMSPKFMAKIMLKDGLNAWGQTGTNPNMLKHLWKNASRIYTNDKFIDQLRLNGFNGNEYYKVDELSDYIRMAGGKGSKTTILNAIDKAYHAYRRMGWISEQLSRTRVAEHILDRGGTYAEAAWQGQNTLNWQKHGYGTAAKILMRTVPFLNAHLQGMIRTYDGMVGRDVTFNRKRAIMSWFAKSMGLAIPAMVLESVNQQNKDYQRLPDYAKDANYNIYIGGHHFMIPKPFEWGMLAATMPQRAMRVAIGKDSGREFWKSVYDVLANDVAMLPIPAAFQEPIEQFANKDLRTGLPIETESQQQREPSDRFNKGTTLAARGIGRAFNMSPVRIQHAVNGYFATVGMFALQMMSGIMRATGHYPSAPGPRGGSWFMEQLESPFGGGKASSEVGNQYLSDFYDAQAVADQVSHSVHDRVTHGEYGRAQQLAEDSPIALRGHHQLQVISVQLAQLRAQERAVESSPYLNAQQKRVQMDAINESQKQLLDRYEPFFRAILDGKKQIEQEP